MVRGLSQSDTPIRPGGPVLPRRVGVIMLDTRFRRPPGDIGAAATFGGLGLFEIVPQARVSAVIADGGAGLLVPFLAARNRLVDRGAEIITTSCGMLAAQQTALQHGCRIPVVASALLQIAARQAELPPGRALGVIAMDRRGLTPALLRAIDAPANLVIGGLEHGRELYRVLAADDPTLDLDPECAAADVIDCARAMLAERPDIGAFVFECANLPPYRAAVQAAIGLPVYDLLTMLVERLAADVLPANAI